MPQRANHSAKHLTNSPSGLPAVLQRRDTSIPKMREARIYGVSQLAQGHSARKWQSWVLSNHKTPSSPQAHRHVEPGPTNGAACTGGNLTARVTVRRMGLGSRGCNTKGSEGRSPNSPQKEETRRYLEPPFQDPASSCHKNRNLFIALSSSRHMKLKVEIKSQGEGALVTMNYKSFPSPHPGDFTLPAPIPSGPPSRKPHQHQKTTTTNHSHVQMGTPICVYSWVGLGGMARLCVYPFVYTPG